MLRMPLTRIILMLTSLTLAETSVAMSNEKLRDIASGEFDLIGDAIHNAIDQALGTLGTSLEALQDLASGKDEVVVDAAKEDIDTALSSLKSLTRLLGKHFKTPTRDTEILNINHPNDIYLLIKDVVSFSKDLTDSLAGQVSSLSASGDLMVARSSLLRLQRVYGLKARDMFRGNYRGHLGKALGAQDCVSIAQDAFQQGFPKEAIGWLELAVEELSSAAKPLPHAATTESLALWHLQALALLGRAYFYDNRLGMARNMLKQCKGFKGVTMSGVSDVTELETECNAADPRAAIAEYESSRYATDPFSFLDASGHLSALCSRPRHQRVEALRPFHACRLKPDVHVPYLLYKEEILSLKPYVSLFYDVIYDKEIQDLKELAKEHLKPSETTDGNTSGFEQIYNEHRTSQTAWLGDKHSVVRVVSERTQAMTRLEVLGRKGCPLPAEDLQAVNYGLGGHYTLHTDPLQKVQAKPRYMKQSGDRLATFLLYLTDVEDGGSTVFPYLGISVTPVKGMALLFYNFDPDGQENLSTLHMACPVVIGNKWVANKWILTFGNTFRRPCGLTPDTQQLEIERLVADKFPS